MLFLGRISISACQPNGSEVGELGSVFLRFAYSDEQKEKQSVWKGTLLPPGIRWLWGPVWFRGRHRADFQIPVGRIGSVRLIRTRKC